MKLTWNKELKRYNKSVVKINKERFLAPSALAMLKNPSIKLKDQQSLKLVNKDIHLNQSFDLETNSKLIVDPRMLDPYIDENNMSEETYPPIIDPWIYPKLRAKSYLRILELTRRY